MKRTIALFEDPFAFGFGATPAIRNREELPLAPQEQLVHPSHGQNLSELCRNCSRRTVDTPEPAITGGNRRAVITTNAAPRGNVPLNPWFVSGLTEGEGCFCVSFTLNGKLRTGIEVRPSFALGLNEKDLPLIEDLRTFFGCGSIRESKGDRTFKYESRAVGDLLTRVIPHFQRYRLRGAKAVSFARFVYVCHQIAHGDHLRREGVRRIIDVAYEMNLGQRRISRHDLLTTLRRLHDTLHRRPP